MAGPAPCRSPAPAPLTRRASLPPGSFRAGRVALRSRHAKVLPGRPDRPTSLLASARRIDDPGRRRTQALPDVPLGCDPLIGVVWRHPASQESPSLCRRIASDEPDFVALGCKATLDELDGLDRHGADAVLLGRREGRVDPSTNGWMDDSLESRERFRVREDMPAEGGPVEGAIGTAKPIAELVEHRG